MTAGDVFARTLWHPLTLIGTEHNGEAIRLQLYRLRAVAAPRDRCMPQSQFPLGFELMAL